jgi:hypothetical protein
VVANAEGDVGEQQLPAAMVAGELEHHAPAAGGGREVDLDALLEFGAVGTG